MVQALMARQQSFVYLYKVLGTNTVQGNGPGGAHRRAMAAPDAKFPEPVNGLGFFVRKSDNLPGANLGANSVLIAKPVINGNAVHPVFLRG
jgi:hypothetical protein